MSRPPAVPSSEPEREGEGPPGVVRHPRAVQAQRGRGPVHSGAPAHDAPVTRHAYVIGVRGGGGVERQAGESFADRCVGGRKAF